MGIQNLKSRNRCLLLSSNMADYTIYMIDSSIDTSFFLFLDHKIWLSSCQDSNIKSIDDVPSTPLLAVR